MANTIEYKCPCCGGNVEYSEKEGIMRCPFCDTVFSVEELKEKDSVLHSQPSSETADNSLGIYICRSCGGELLTDENTAATKCPYCANPIILSGRLSGENIPDSVVPFNLSKDDAKTSLKNFMSKKKLLPKSFSSDSRLNEIKGIYVPFWLYDVKTDVNITYKAEKTRQRTEGDYIVRETEIFSVERAGSVTFSGIPMDASKKMPDDMMESLEPFDYSQAKDFSTAYLSGYFADKFDLPPADGISRVNERAKNTSSELFRNTVNGYTGVQTQKSDFNFTNKKPKYALLPVWLLNSDYEGKTYSFAMNGQTGKFVGEMPMDKKAYLKWKLIYTLVFSVLSFAMLFVISMFLDDFSALSVLGVLISIALGFIISIAPMNSLKKEINNVEFNKTAYNYIGDNSFILSVKQDRLVDKKVTRQRIEKPAPQQKTVGRGGTPRL
ncbi:MAG: hypothetical protein J1E34_04930 [Oscillospiraceae bacterium]|nr:hypothetical protein [Oscillospiraceae bacterium]